MGNRHTERAQHVKRRQLREQCCGVSIFFKHKTYMPHNFKLDLFTEDIPEAYSVTSETKAELH